MGLPAYPYSNVVYILTVIGGVKYQASGVLISPDEVLTASHVVYSAGVGIATSLTISPAYSQGSAPLGTFASAYYHDNPVNDANGLISNASSQADYAVIHLSTPTAETGVGVQAVASGGNVVVAAYPAYAGGSMVDTPETVTQDPTYTLLDGVDTGAGSSGGPLFEFQNANGVSTPSVVGLVSSGNGVNGYDVEITASAAAQIQSWVQQDDYSNPLFEKTFYDAHYPDVAAAPVNPAYHYETTGWKEGRDPDAFFSTSGYLGANKDVAAAGVNPLDQFEQFGWKEGRDPGPNFSDRLYLLHNADVAKAGLDPLQHYLQDGASEGRATYAVISPANTLVKDFDPGYYLLANPDVAKAGVDPLTHFLTIGWKEGRNPDAFFDTKGYLAANPDVAAAGVDPLLQFEQSGWKEGRNPSATFDTKDYLAANPDVAAAGIDPLMHYLTNGAFELRLPLGDGRFT